MKFKWLILALTLICTTALYLADSQFLLKSYQTIGATLAIDPKWIAKNSKQISNFGHLVIGAALGFLSLALNSKRFWLPLFAAAAFLITCEFLQYFIPSREIKLEDFVLSLSGIIIAGIIYRFFKLTIGKVS